MNWMQRTVKAAAEVGIKLYIEDMNWVPTGRIVRLAQNTGHGHQTQYYDLGTEATNQLLITIDTLQSIAGGGCTCEKA